MKKLLTTITAIISLSAVWGQCLPTYNTQCTSGDYINNVTFNTINNLGTGCSSPGANNYQDYTAISTSVQQNMSYTITVTPGPSWGQYFVAFIDFNNDLDFNDPGEFFDIGYASAGTTILNTILIPNGIPGGAVTMRVLCKYSSGPVLAGQACNNFSYGECEDYTLNISSPLADDAGISAFVTPSLPTCNFADSVRVSISNFGTDTLFSATINWSVNATPMTPFSWTGALAPFNSETVNLGLTTLVTGDALDATTSMPNGVVENPSGAWNNTSTIASLQAGLSGLYTIGGATPDYVDFATAIADLNTFGVCAPVTFDVRDGIYTEQLDLSPITGMDSTNSVTFKSENGNASLVTVSFLPTSGAQNYIVNLNGADNFIFKDLTLENTGTFIGRVVQLMNGADENLFQDCHLHTTSTFTTSTATAVIYSPSGSNDNNNVFMNNIIEGGSYGAYMFGEGSTSLEVGTIFQGNTFLNNYYYGIRLNFQDAPTLIGNSMIGESSYTGARFAVYLNYCDNGFIASENIIKGSPTSAWRYGLYIINCDATVSNHAKVSNNMVQVGLTGSTSTYYGIYLSNDGYIDITHNSASITEGGSSSRTFYGIGGGANTLANNIFVNYTPGYAIYLASNYTIISSDFNLLHSPFGNIGHYNGMNQANMTDWQTSSGSDANSVNMDPMFHSNYDLHVCNDSIKGLATPLSIITDIDGQARSLISPDMGADEFSALSTNFLGNDVEFCSGETITLSAGAPSDTILWSTGDTTTSIDVSVANTYTVSINGACGTGTDTINVTMSNLVYTNFLTATDTTFCEGDSAILGSSMAADTYTWSNAATSPTIPVTTSGLYTLSITDNCGSGNENVNISVLTVPVATFTSVNSYTSTSFTNTSTGSNSTYFWDFGDGGTSTAENPDHVFSNAGPHTVSLTVTNMCGTDTYNTIISMVAINELSSAGSINIYPNPSTGLITLNLDLLTQSKVALSIQNVLGKVVYSNDLKLIEGKLSYEINLSNESAGVYFVHINVDGRKTVKKVIIR